MYNKDESWDSMSGMVGGRSRSMMSTLQQGETAYQKWLSFAADHADNAAIAVYFNGKGASVDADDVAALAAAFAALDAFYRVADNEVVAQADHNYAMRKFA